MRYVMARMLDRQTDMIYRIYITDALQMAVLNTSGGEKRGILEKRYSDLIHPPKEETRTAQEIIDNIRAKLGD